MRIVIALLVMGQLVGCGGADPNQSLKPYPQVGEPGAQMPGQWLDKNAPAGSTFKLVSDSNKDFRYIERDENGMVRREVTHVVSPIIEQRTGGFLTSNRDNANAIRDAYRYAGEFAERQFDRMMPLLAARQQQQAAPQQASWMQQQFERWLASQVPPGSQPSMIPAR